MRDPRPEEAGKHRVGRERDRHTDPRTAQGALILVGGRHRESLCDESHGRHMAHRSFARLPGCRRPIRIAGAPPWWRAGVLYQIYPRSFADSNGDGHGDLRGVIDHLDHLEWLGVDGVWLSPINTSPQADWGYDVADYKGIEPDFGSLEDLDRLVAEAGARGIRVLMDLVPNHTSDRHAWFVDARSSRQAEHRDWYVWADAKPDGSPPNNWRSSFGGPAWTWDEATGQYYLHNFLPEQPDLNWWNPDVGSAFENIIRFWFDRGVAGFRIDVAHAFVKDRSLRDDSVALETDHRAHPSARHCAPTSA